MQISVVLRTAMLFALVPGVGSEQTIYKCVGKGKPPSFQTQPCSADQREAKAVRFTPDSVSLYRPDVQSRPYGQRERSAALVKIPRASAPTACDRARNRRDNVLGQNNQGGNYHVRVQLNDAVQRACN